MNRHKNKICGIPGYESIHYRYNGHMECIFIKDITFIKSEGVYSMIYLDSAVQAEKKMICRSVRFLEKLLKEYGFVRCHKSYLVNNEKVEYFCSATKVLSVCRIILPVAVRKSSKVFSFLLEKGKKDISTHNVNKVI